MIATCPSIRPSFARSHFTPIRKQRIISRSLLERGFGSGSVQASFHRLLFSCRNRRHQNPLGSARDARSGRRLPDFGMILRIISAETLVEPVLISVLIWPGSPNP
jgi:hypothetical protein